MKCFLSGRAPLGLTDPGFQYIHGVSNIHQKEARFVVSNECYFTMCAGSDERAADLFFSMQEAESSGYTDAGFADYLTKSVQALGGEIALGVWTFKLETATDIQNVQGCFIMLGLRPDQTGVIVWQRSGAPIDGGLLEALNKLCPTVDLPTVAYWNDDYRFLVTGSEKTLESPIADPVVRDAFIETAQKKFGSESWFQLLMRSETNTGFELIRRFIL